MWESHEPRVPASREFPAGMGNWTSESHHSKSPSSPAYPFPKGQPSGDPWLEGFLMPNFQLSGGQRGGSRRAHLGFYTPSPKLPLSAAPTGLTGRGSSAAGTRGPPFRLRWCRLWLGLRPGSRSVLALGGAARGPPLVPPPASGKPLRHPAP